jgi:hypothetical protein
MAFASSSGPPRRCSSTAPRPGTASRSACASSAPTPAPGRSARRSCPASATTSSARTPRAGRRISAPSRARFSGVYPGIDLVYYGNPRDPELDLILAPGADPRLVLLEFDRARKVEIDGEGDLVVHAGTGRLGDDAVVAKLSPDGSSLVFSTYLGSSGNDWPSDVVLDAAGGIHVAGWTSGPDFPLVNPLQPALLGPSDAFLAQLLPSGAALVHSTYLGGSGDDRAEGIDVDPAGNAWVTGMTRSADFPLACPSNRRTPGDLGNTLRAVHSPADVLLTWGFDPLARSYTLHRGTAKGAWQSPAFLPGLPLPAAAVPDLLPPPTLYFYRAAGASCSGNEGP